MGKRDREWKYHWFIDTGPVIHLFHTISNISNKVSLKSDAKIWYILKTEGELFMFLKISIPHPSLENMGGSPRIGIIFLCSCYLLA